MHRISKIRHTGIVTDKMEDSLHFYRDILGFEVKSDCEENSRFIDVILGLENSRLRTVKMTCPDGQMIELLDFRSLTEIRNKFSLTQIGVTHIALQTDNIDELYSFLKAINIFFIASPAVSPDGCAKVAFCRAPEGTYVEFVEILK